MIETYEKMEMQMCLLVTFLLFHLGFAFSSNFTTADVERRCAMQTESSSLTYLVDTTGSMYDDFIELKAVNSWLLDRVTARFPCGVRQYTMVEFNDPTVGPVRKTNSKNEFGYFFNKLVATGGGDCPELAMRGLKLALENTPPNSLILVLTDASALDYWDTTLINRIYSLIASSRSQVFFLITGLCGNIYDADFIVYREIAAASFGLVFQVSLSDLNKVFHYLDFTLSRPLNSSIRLFSGEYTDGYNYASFAVTDNFKSIIITTDGVIYHIQVLGPDYIEFPLKQIVSELWGSIYLLKNPGHGVWTLVIYAGSRYSLRVEGLTGLNISYPSTAFNTSICAADEERKLKNGVYGCYCKDEFEVADVADIRPALTCDVYDMRAVFQKCQLTSLDINANNVTLKDAECFGFRDDPSMNTITITSPIHAGACGLQIIKNGTSVTYKSTMHLMLKSTGLIEKYQELTVTIFCSYPLDMMVSLNTAVKPFYGSTNITVGGTGQLTAYMALYKDSSYVIPYEGSEVVLPTKSMMYVGVFVHGGDAFEYVLVMRTCYTTPSPNADDPLKYYIIQDSCPNKQDSTISVPENGVSKKGRLSLQAIKFAGNYSYVYIHCAISLCDITAGSCAPSCSGIRSRSAEQSYMLSLGPINLKDEVKNTPSSGCIGTHKFSVLIGFVFLLMTQDWFD
ncbi:pancreatic secretory granule membrane major glycoprotein GP2-like isoform X3 [Phyllobates terribilis]|uniref:pancreatic secretory granule membrane major glycoprotein GP2-like isoform X3 n=1 Tax=Phyllobates terribilis TaxID=111132 RepID=UPI003CCB6862